MQWFLSQVGKAIDCNSMITGSNPVGTSKIQQTYKLVEGQLPYHDSDQSTHE